VEKVPESRKANYWRFGVREIDKEIYELIIRLAGTGIIDKKKIRLPSLSNEFESTRKEGKKKYRFTTYYERNPFNRAKAVEIHGLNCMACNFNFSKVYGELGEGYINVHHLRPVSELGEEVQIDPQKDLIVLCANCHAMIHKDKEHTLSPEELKGYIS
jgi:putative restriction endonuclease